MKDIYDLASSKRNVVKKSLTAYFCEGSTVTFLFSGEFNYGSVELSIFCDVLG